jgi:Swt1-like HEPN
LRHSDFDPVRNWLFRSIMFEAEAEGFRSAGIRIGADHVETERQLLTETLAPFPVDLRTQALQMTRLYALLYCFENSVRQLIRERLEEKEGGDWWDKSVPKAVREQAAKRQQNAKANSWLEGEKGHPLQFVDFGDLSSIILHNWEDFSDLVPSQHWIKQRMDELEQARNFIAHSRLLLPAEFQRIESYIADWNKQVGV